MYRFRIDYPLLMGLLILCAVSQVILYSAGGESTRLLINQGIRMAVALVVMLILAQARPANWRRWAPYLFMAGLVMLVMVLLIGHTGKGAQRWLNLGFFRFQPSELMKIAVPMMVAWVITRKELPPNLKTLFWAGVVLLLPAALIIQQPDLGTTIMIMLSGLVIIFLAGFSWRGIGVLSVFSIVAAPIMWQFLHAYQQRRILTLFDPWSDPLGAGYHTIQSMIAIGSGGAQGKGWLSGSQSQLEFIPERHTDFIFSVFAEEFGFIGVMLLFTLYILITLRGLYIAYSAQDAFSRLLAGSLSLTFFFYVFVNVGMVSGLLPVVGVPLPLISYGGTSMVTLMAAFGILMSIHSHRTMMAGS